ncbi:MAG: hypothetical protein C4304_02380 [candidate division GAL15 bacterium]
MNPVRLMGTGAALLVGSWGVVFLMVLRELPPDLGLALVAYGTSVVGLGLGIVGAALWARGRRVR